MKNVKFILKILVVLPVLITFFSCNPIENDSTSPSLLIVQEILGMDAEGNEANFLQSDVIVQDPDNPEDSSIKSDSVRASFKASLLEPASVNGPSQYNDITVTRYIVSYMRSDGKNVEGVDVPYSFEGYLTAMIPIGSTVEVTFVIVREVAKNEPPLVDLVFGTQEGVIEATARIDFYGHDQANREVKATGYITIFFANYANESGGGGSEPTGGGL
ncbi:MAG: hypothetical protein JXB23_12165 [Candidatus Aminicenantes bacterium]|nr:hypothetical protein [Candidatus Aminicenantes bacterium]